MIGWTAVVPFKLGAETKSRLAAVLSPEQRGELGVQMAGLVIAALGAVVGIAEVIVLGPSIDPQWPVRHVRDRGRGLNNELNDLARTNGGPLLVIHADLPLVLPQDIADLLVAAERNGSAIAPDRHRQGTNALALSELPGGFEFAFGAGSFSAHRNALGEFLAIVDRAGLGCDIDTPADLDFGASKGFSGLVRSA